MTEGEGDEALQTPAQLGIWLESERDRLGPVEPEVALRIEDFRALRDVMRELFSAADRGDPLPVAAIDRVNQASAAVPGYPILDAIDPLRPRAAEVRASGSRTNELIAVIARSAIQILGGGDRGRVRACGAPGCGRFFLADRPRQLWCTRACGNRVRVGRHRARARG
jgi:predicted RNA-binding Zn ribbon-like protein